MTKENVIIKVEDGSIAQELGVETGDILVSINENEVKDVFDYRYLIQDEYIEFEIKKPNGEHWVLEIEKEEYEDLGIIFESGLMDKAKSCSNKCIFCFIDQLPKGMRKTLYFKDDDSRLSFLQGNYVTLTNMKEKDIDRLIFYHLSPINISVHTTDLELRKFMLKNPNANNILRYIKKFSDAGIQMNFQIVLCKGINDGEKLDKTIKDLSFFIPKAVSVSVVPLGITKYRDKLCNLELFDSIDSAKIIKQVEKWQNKFYDKYGTRFVFLSDEFYLKAGKPLPDYCCYEDFVQLENGVGMLTLMKKEFDDYINKVNFDYNKNVSISIATGIAAYDFISGLCKILENKFKGLSIDVFAIKNEFFGETITVSGLLTGTDIINQLKDKKMGDFLLVPENALMADSTIFLDNIDIKNIENELNVKVIVSKNNGTEFIKQIISL